MDIFNIFKKTATSPTPPASDAAPAKKKPHRLTRRWFTVDGEEWLLEIHPDKGINVRKKLSRKPVLVTPQHLVTLAKRVLSGSLEL